MTPASRQRRSGRRAALAAAVALPLALLGAGQQDLPPVRADAPSVAPSRRGFTVKVAEPADGAVVFGLQRLRAEVESDEPDRVLEVRFLVGDELVFVDQEAPYQTVYDFGSEARSVVIRAVARHVAGFDVEDAVVTRQLRLNYSLEVRRVKLSLTVTDKTGRPAQNVQRDEVVVVEDGVEQEILDFDIETRPLRIALVVDTSGSMRERLPQVQMAASSFLDVLGPEDRAMVVDFDDQVMLLQPLTDRRDDLRDALMSTFARGGTAMYDAVHATLRRLAGETERKAIVLLSDGGDTASVMDRNKAVEAARSSDALIYTIGVGGGTDRGVLKSLSSETGGRAFFVDRAEELGEVYRQVADELRRQYIVTYSSSNPEYDGKWRKVQARHVGSDDLQIRTRKGYYALRRVTSPLEQPIIQAAPEESTSGAVEAAAPAAGSPTAPPPSAPDSPPGG